MSETCGQALATPTDAPAPGVALWHGDCMDVMGRMRPKSVDAVIADPPYGVLDLDWDVPVDMREWFALARRVCRQGSNVLVFCRQPFTTAVVSAAHKGEFSHPLVWVKNTATRAMSSEKLPLACYEEVMVFRVNRVANADLHQGLRRYFADELAASGMTVGEVEEAVGNRSAHHYFRSGGDFRVPTRETYERMRAATGRFARPYGEVRAEFDAGRRGRCTYNAPPDNRDVIWASVPAGAARVHPTQKPVSLLGRLVDAYCPKGGVVLDPFMGSGSTGVACAERGRGFVGVERDGHYYDVAYRRVLDACLGVPDA